MEPLATFEHAGCTVHLCCDDDPMPPSDWDTLGTLVVSRDVDWSPRGAQRMSATEEDAIERDVSGLLMRYLSMTNHGLVIGVRVEDYGSSGVRLYEEDEYPNAYLVTSPEKVVTFLGEATPEQAREGLRAELDVWRAYFEGDVIGYVVECGGEMIDSCWGFYTVGIPDDVREEAELDDSPLCAEHYCEVTWEHEQ